MVEYEMGEMWVDKIHPDPNQPRKEFDKEELKAFAEGLKRQGIINPIEIDEDNVIIDGERRWRACKMAGITKIPYKRKKLKELSKTDPNFRLKRQLQANLTGRNLKINEARGQIEKLSSALQFSKGGRGHEEGLSQLARELGITKQYLSQILHLAKEGSEKVKDAVEKREIPLSAGVEIAHIENKEIQNKVLDHVVNDNLTRDQTRKLVKNLKDKPEDEAQKLIEMSEAILPKAKETAQAITDAITKINGKYPVDEQDQARYASYLFLRAIQGALDQGKLFCPKCKKQHGLKWTCCGENIRVTIAHASKKYGGEKDV